MTDIFTTVLRRRQFSVSVCQTENGSQFRIEAAVVKQLTALEEAFALQATLVRIPDPIRVGQRVLMVELPQAYQLHVPGTAVDLIEITEQLKCLERVLVCMALHGVYLSELDLSEVCVSAIDPWDVFLTPVYVIAHLKDPNAVLEMPEDYAMLLVDQAYRELRKTHERLFFIDYRI